MVDIAVLAAIVYALVTAVVVAFQLGLAFGAPWGDFAMGGAFTGAYPPAMRVAAVLQALLLAILALIVLATAGVIESPWRETPEWLIWGVMVFAALGVLLNAISRSPGERRLWVPVTLVMLITSALVGHYS